MATTLWNIAFKQTGIPALIPIESALTFGGLGVMLYLIYAYFKNKRNASFWVSKTAFAVYALALVTGLAPVNYEVYAEVLGTFGATFMAIMEILMKLSYRVFLAPVILSGAIVMGIELFDDIIAMAQGKKEWGEFLKLD